MKKIALHLIVDVAEFIFVSLLVATYFATKVTANINPKRK
jgi:hypothetical protein